MARADFDISGSGGQSVIYVDGSNRCVLNGSKIMLWNGRNDLSDCELVAFLKPYVNENSGRQRGGFIFRCDAALLNYYKLLVYGYTNYRKYYLFRIVNGVSTQLSQNTSYLGYNIYIKTRLRVSSFQISLEEFVGGDWILVGVFEDGDHSVVSGYAGLISNNYNNNYSFIFDDFSVGEKTG